ncbi:sulfite exporter TauE/SafE family protein [Hirschia maritima]|uniref:sulfite exporter TauE/SafE family protein n=1 Tax=Hirschia maritima TaxID=1121961 RepID=UPI000365B85A|nr:sulfite exporter TauE/SafE family protein [Hirschia maritima]
MTPEIFFYLCAAFAVIVTGLSKGGFAGIGALAMPIMALGGDPVAGAAILLPILICQDAVGIWSYRKTIDKRVTLIMLPSMSLGVYLGYLYADMLSKDAIMGAVGAISLIFGARNLWQTFHKKEHPPKKSNIGSGLFFGTITGFTSQIAHAGGPPFYMWILPQKLPRDLLIGTKSIVFGFVNWIKVPAFLALGQMTIPNLKTSAILLPLAILATLAGVMIVRRIETARFYKFIYVMMCVLGAKLIFEAFY